MVTTHSDAQTLAELEDGFAVVRVPMGLLREQDKNARIMTPQMQASLAANIRRDGHLESLPLCHRLDSGEFEIISGHHRKRAAMQAEMDELVVLAYMRQLEPGVVRAKQIAHNSHEGFDDLTTLREMYLYYFAALYQQRPAPREGGLFKSHWFEIVEASPLQGEVIRRWDLAATADGGDWTVGVRMRKAPTGFFYIEDVIRERLSPAGVRTLVKNTAQRDGYGVKIILPQDPGQAGKDQAQSIIRELAGFNVSAKTESGSKDVRAEPMAAQAEAGNVKLVKGRWNSDFLDELCLFPHGSHDDQVDGAAGAFAELATGSSGIPSFAFGHMRNPSRNF